MDGSIKKLLTLKHGNHSIVSIYAIVSSNHLIMTFWYKIMKMCILNYSSTKVLVILFVMIFVTREYYTLIILMVYRVTCRVVKMA